MDALSRVTGGMLSSLEVVMTTEDTWYNKKKNDIHEYPEKYADWRIEDDQLYHRRPDMQIDPTLPDLIQWKSVFPVEVRAKVMEYAHCLPQSGHYGIDKTYHRIAQEFYWPGFFQDVVTFVKQCPVGQQYKPTQRGPIGVMRERTVEGLWSIITADIMGPFPPSKVQKKYLLVFQDYFTK